ncbi:unnamed protein product [Effrenium voratum]|uniref:NADPH--hemoprotein reductase n=1 Tax=Effrenium voratum TaxID=2562239 RepID=A0AA36I1C8_9DINO|nr:unnamed protein product [Effrenium voratum]
MATPFKYLLLFTGFSACAQFDSGALAAFEKYLTTELGLSTSHVGFINAMEYIMLPLASPLIPLLLRCWHVKAVLLVCVVGNMVGVLGLAFAPVIEEAQLLPFLVVSRTLSGMCHAGIAVYGSVWVDLYAPKESATSWLGAMQASSLVGLVVGYSIAGYWGQWERVFYLNLLWFAGVFLALFITPGDFLASASRRRARSGEVRLSFVSVPSGSFVAAPMESLEEEQPLASPSGEFAQMSVQPSFQSRQVRRASAEAEEHLPLYFLMATCVSSLFFVSGGLQFWATPYMQQLWLGDAKCSPEMLESAQHLVVTLVASTTLTAPTFGVFLGGSAVDRAGGYKGAAARRCVQLLAGGAALAMLFGVLACFCKQFWVAVASFWVFNMLGAALMPGAFGLMLAAVRPDRRSAASAGAQVPINLLGMAGGAFIPGWMAGCQPDAGEACSSGPAVGFAALALALAYLNKAASRSSETIQQELSVDVRSRSNTAASAATHASSASRPSRATITSPNTMMLGIIDQVDGKAGTTILHLDKAMSFAELLARCANSTGTAVRRLFSEDGKTEIFSLQDLKRIYENREESGSQVRRATDQGMKIDLEVVSTDGSNFKWKWGSDHAHYSFGDLLIRPLWRSLTGSRQARSARHPPQPPVLPTTGNLKDCLPDLWVQCFGLVERYGPLVKLRIFDDVVYVCADPEVVDIVNQIPDKRLPKEVFGCKAVAGQGVFIADGQRWEFGRHALQAQLTPEAIDSLVPIFAGKCLKLQEIIAANADNIDMFAWVEKVTMDVICDVGFGHNLKCMESPEMPELLPLFDEVIEASINTSLYGAFDVLGTRKRWFEGQLSKLDGMLDEIIEAVREGKHTGSSNSLLHHLCAAKCPLTARGFTQSELRDQLLTMLVAGHKTTTLLLTWGLYHIARSARVEKKLFAELRQVFEGDLTRPPTGEDLRRLKYMDMVVRETLRLCAPVQVAQRGLTQPVQCGEYTLLPGGHSGRGNSWVAIHIMGISRSKKYWGEDALEFIPERFEPAKMAKFHPFQFIPFGGGRRLCIGNLFAITQAKTLLCLILRKFYVRTIPEKPVQIDPKDIATPLPASRGGGVWLQFTGRDDGLEPEEVAEPPTLGNMAKSFLDEGGADRGSVYPRRSSGCWNFSGPKPPLLILWGGQFGTTQSAAQDLAKSAQQRNFEVEVKAMDEVKPSELLAGLKVKDEQPVVLILIATYNGHPPENAAAFCKALEEVPPSDKSADINFAVLGVGNSNWISTYIKVAKEVDKHMARAGARRFLPLEVADKNDCFEKSVRSWRQAVLSTFANSPEDFVQEQIAAAAEQIAEVIPETLELAPSSKPPTSMSEHFVTSLGYESCKISSNEELCQRAEDAEAPSVRQIRVASAGAYCCGDHLEVRPRNSAAQVERACRRLACQAESVVVASDSEELPSDPLSMGDILAYHVDLSALPSQETLASLAQYATKSQEATSLRQLATIKEDSAYDEWCERCLSLLDVLDEFRSVSIGFSRFVEVAPKIKPRLYSIASSPLARGTDAELCCRVAKYQACASALPEVRSGLCSSMLASATEVICKIKEAPHMRLPKDPSTPIACVCGGTGLAPFYGFLQEREQCRKQGTASGLVQLYFGCRNEEDFLHQAQLQRWHAEGLLSLKVSFSRPRDPALKEYVYHALRRDAEAVLELLSEDGLGCLYVCGSASTLAKDVTNVLVDLLSQHGDATVGFARLDGLQEKGRVIFDVWG